MLGLMAGLGLAWFRETLDQSFHSVLDVEVYLGIPVIATIPNLAEEKRREAHAYRRHSARR
jgi:capsular polysaccharide biosynthesis protein